MRTNLKNRLVRPLSAAFLAAFVTMSTDVVVAQDPAVKRGLAFVRAHCAQCHAIDMSSASSLDIAPPFRTLHLRYPVENLAEALAEGISTGHASMPEFQLDSGHVGDVIAYLESLER